MVEIFRFALHRFIQEENFQNIFFYIFNVPSLNQCSQEYIFLYFLFGVAKSAKEQMYFSTSLNVFFYIFTMVASETNFPGCIFLYSGCIFLYSLCDCPKHISYGMYFSTFLTCPLFHCKTLYFYREKV